MRDKNRKGLISRKMEAETEVKSKNERLKQTLKDIPVIEKVDMGIDDVFSEYYNTETQLKLEKIWSKLNSPMRKVGDFLDKNHIELKDKEISFKGVAKHLNLTEGQVYTAIQNLQQYEPYTYVFHPTRKKKKPGNKHGSFKFSNDDYLGWSKENDIREKVINKKLVVLRKGQDKMFPKFKEQILDHKLDKIDRLKKLITLRQQGKKYGDDEEYEGDEDEEE